MLLFSTLLCKKIARAPGGHKKIMLTKLGGRNRIDPNIDLGNSGFERAGILMESMRQKL